MGVSSEFRFDADALQALLPDFEACVPAILNDVRDGLVHISARYAAFLGERFAEVQLAANGAMQLLLLSTRSPQLDLENSDPELSEDALFEQSLFQEIGRVQWREGEQIGALLSAYQLGARVTWRHLSAAALAGGIDPGALATLAESVFCFVDQLSSASVDGYFAEQASAAAERERARDELVELLISDRSTAAGVRAAAMRAGWPLPKTVAIVLVEPSDEIGRSIVSGLDRCLPVHHAGLLGAVIADPAAPGSRSRLSRLLRGSSAVVGPTVPVDRLGASATIASIAARLSHDGVLLDNPVFVDEHLDAVLVHREPMLLAALQRSVLAPLDSASAGSRDDLRATLASWLAHMGDRRAIAAQLHVHPQTVRYRMTRLRELFGDALDDPQRRLALTLALSWDSPARTARTASR